MKDVVQSFLDAVVDLRELAFSEVKEEVTSRATDLIKEMQMVFQNPDSTLNPSYTVGKQIARPIRRFKTVPGDQVKATTAPNRPVRPFSARCE